MNLGILPDKYVNGIKEYKDLTTVPLAGMEAMQALCTQFTTDAHCITYEMYYGSEAIAPRRVNKPALSWLRDAGYDVKTTTIMVDYDRPGHEAWTAEAREAFERSLLEAADAEFDLTIRWSFFYYTKGGARFGYVLSEPISVELAEGVMRGIARDFAAYGIITDPVLDWTRLYRLPQVMRDGVPTWTEGYYEMLVQEGVTLDPYSITPGATAITHQYAAVEELSLPQPDPQWSLQALHEINPDSGREILTYWAKAAKKALSGRDCYEILFREAPLAARGNRNSEIQRLVGEAIAVLHGAGLRGTSPELIYALFYQALQQLNARDPDEAEDFTATGWRAVLSYWAKESAKVQHEKEEDAKRTEHIAKEQTSLLGSLLQGMRSWCDAPELMKDDQSAYWWIQNKLILGVQGGTYHVLQPDGFYTTDNVTGPNLISKIRQLGMDRLMPVTELNQKGEQVFMHWSKVVNIYATQIPRVSCMMRGPKAIVSQLGNESEQDLILPINFRSMILVPQYSPRVDAWIWQFGGDNYDLLTNWLGQALAFEEGPIAALSIKGEPGCGKKMLAVGLSECLQYPIYATSAEFAGFGDMLLRTPLMVINEGIHRAQGGQDVPDMFRSLVSGDPVRVRPMYKPPMMVSNPLRIMITANNTDVVGELVGDRDLSPEDRRAIAERIVHIEVPRGCSAWLRAKGGLNYTRGWIRSDNGTPGTYELACHILHLYATRTPVPAGNRYLTEGNIQDRLVLSMVTRGGTAPLVIECLIKMINTVPKKYGFTIYDNRVFATSQGVVEYFRDFVATSVRKGDISVATVSKVLRGLQAVTEDAYAGGVRTLPTPDGGKMRARWREVDVQTLYQEAVEFGYRCPQLEALATRQKSLEIKTEETMRQIQEAMQ